MNYKQKSEIAKDNELASSLFSLIEKKPKI